MKIPPEDFHWYAAFHDEGNHPHVHMMAWSAKPNQAYLSKDGIRQIKSTLTNQIFRQELLHVYEQKSKSRDELVSEARKAMLELAKAMREMTCIHPEAEQMIWNLSRQLGQVGGRKTYGYLPKPLKKLVDEIVDQMARLPTVDACYQTRWELQCQVEDYFSEGKKRLHPPLSQQKEFRQIKNAVIREAEHIRMNKISFEDAEMQDDGEQISAYAMSYACQDLQSVANDESFPLVERDEAAEQLERLADAGDAYAQYIIGTAYRDGGLLIPDTVKAQKLLERAAEQDLDAAQYALGKLYLSDDADVHDPAKGIYWLKRSADNGNDYAAYRLGKEYLSGKNTIKDAETAVSYLRQAAHNGNANAQYLLGQLTLHAAQPAVDVLVHVQHLAVGVGVGVAQFDLGLQFCDSRRLASLVADARVILAASAGRCARRSVGHRHHRCHVRSRVAHAIAAEQVAERTASVEDAERSTGNAQTQTGPGHAFGSILFLFHHAPSFLPSFLHKKRTCAYQMHVRFISGFCQSSTLRIASTVG